jgi:DNA polymerase
VAERGRQVAHEPQPGEPVSDLLPERSTLSSVRAIASGCKACDLYKRGAQTVFGEGPAKAEVMLVGEQPGDAEDIEGHPFVGPAGKLLDRALEEAGIDRYFRKVAATL